jgi:acyl transferase domain-containing protein
MTQNSKKSKSSGPDAGSAPRVDHDQTKGLIAIIGIGCRFPGANGPENFWQLLKDGADVITEVPSDRFDLDTFFDSKSNSAGKVKTRYGGFIKDVDRFDAAFFNISPREAARMDPQQRLLLEVTWEALEDAGQLADELIGTQTGVFIGMISNDYEDLIFNDPATVDVYVNTGCARSVASGRLSYAFGLQGPSITVDTACSSSLVAVHLACQSILNGECSQAIAGGTNLILIPQPSIGWSQANNLAPDGRCKAFDIRANGFIRSDGVGVVILKDFESALADGDPIYATIRGSAVNNDGRGSGLLMSPAQKGHESLLREAYRSAGIAPNEVDYVEAHGTGTKVGDPIEVKALGSILGEGRSKEHPLRIGSVKTNIGHTEGAAGIAGLIKVALCLKHKAIPPSLHLQNPNPDIPWQELPIVVQQELQPWPESSNRAIASVSSFGISGTNAHVVVEEAPQNSAIEEKPIASGPHLLTLSAHSKQALEALARRYSDFVQAKASETLSLSDLCYTASARRAHHDHRLAVVVNSEEEVVANLNAFIEGESRVGMTSGDVGEGQRHKLVFVFPGQGSQWFGMGRELMEKEAVFREVIQRCDLSMRQEVEWSLLEVLTSDDAHSQLSEIDVIQPTIFAIQIALASLWRSWGIEPDIVVGQSMGEVAAAYTAGALSLEDALQVICRRSRLLKRVSGQGSMAVVNLPMNQAQERLAGYEDLLSIAVSNSPTSTVIAGDPQALKKVLAGLQEDDIFCKPIKVDVASHSPQMEPLQDDLLNLLQDLQPRPAALPFYSTVIGAQSDSLLLDASYWWQNLRKPVRFSLAVQELIESGHDIFLEISPHPILLGAIQEGIHHSGKQAYILPSMRREEGERAVMLGSLGSLHTLGHTVNWDNLFPSGGRLAPLPLYAWQGERFWLEDLITNGSRAARHTLHGSKPAGHPLLGQHLNSATSSGTHYWEASISAAWPSYLNDHRVRGTVVLPAASYLEMALSAANEAFGDASYVIERVEFKKALFLSEENLQKIQTTLAVETPGKVSFKIFSSSDDETNSNPVWTLNASGTIRFDKTNTQSPVAQPALEESKAQLQNICSSEDHYSALLKLGLEYGPSLHGVQQLWRKDNEAIASLRLAEELETESDLYLIHPVLLDASFQVLAFLVPQAPEGTTYLPVSLDTLRVYNRPISSLWCRVVSRNNTSEEADIFKGDVYILNEDGQTVLEAEGLSFQKLSSDSERDIEQLLNEWLYEIQWQHQPRTEQAIAQTQYSTSNKGTWIILADSNDVGDRLASLLRLNGFDCVLAFAGEDFKLIGPGRYEFNPARPQEFDLFIKDSLKDGNSSCMGIVHLWSLNSYSQDGLTLETLDTAQLMGCESALHLLKSLATDEKTVSSKPPRLWLVTSGVHAVEGITETVSVAQSALWGLGRVISYEHPELQCTKIDLSYPVSPEDIQSLHAELTSESREDQIALRGDVRYAARLVRHELKDTTTLPEESLKIRAADQPFRLEVSTPGTLDNLRLRVIERRKLAANEIEIEVEATGLNFRDVMKALNIYPGMDAEVFPFGDECAGRIVAIGESVKEFNIGDEVLAIADHSFGSYVVTNDLLAWHKPDNLSFEMAATIPIAFMTAYYALHHLGRLNKGERVLIHSAAGGVGLAAVQIAQRAGAEIFATAGSSEKREFLKSIGIQHVMDSRSLDFAEEILEITDNEGVDVVLNSLAGEAIQRNLSLLRPSGRFLEIGSRDIYQNSQLGLIPFRNNLSFFAINIDQCWRRNPALINLLMKEVLQAIDEGTFTTLPNHVFPVREIVSAFRHMAQAKQIGKIVVSMRDSEALVSLASGVSAIRLSDEGTYLITGGLGGLGLSVAQWLIDKGVRNIVLMGRSEPTAEARSILDGIAKDGANIRTAQADVSDLQQVARVITDIKESMPPLRGVIHAAGILDDAILIQSDREKFKKVFAPKMRGAWNLHTQTINEPLDFFIMFSSAASLLGSPGQGNYAAANAFLDALAFYRRSMKLPALSVNWGPWSDVGLAARPDRGGRLALRGVGSITPEQGIKALERLLTDDIPQVAVMPFHLDDWRQYYPVSNELSFFSELRSKQVEITSKSSNRNGKQSLNREMLLALDPAERQPLLESYLCEQLSRILGLPPSKLDVSQRLNRLGIDSLMAIEMKNRVEVDLRVIIPMVKLLRGLSIATYATEILEQLSTNTPATPVPVEEVIAQSKFDQAQSLLANLEQLSDTEVDSLLHSMLAAEGMTNE